MKAGKRHIGQGIVVRQVQSPAVHLPVKPRPLFGRQPVEGEMVGRQGDRSVEIGQPAGKGLARESIDQVQVQVGKASPASGTDSPTSLAASTMPVSTVPSRRKALNENGVRVVMASGSHPRT